MKQKNSRLLLILLAISFILASGIIYVPVTAEEEPVTLRFASWQSNYKEDDQRAADAYHELNPNVTVEFEYYGDQNQNDYLQKLDLMILGDEPIDLGGCSATQYHTMRANSGTYLSLNPYFEEEGIDPEEIYIGLLPQDGEYYMLPAEWKAWIVLINQDLLEEAGLELPPLNWTWDDFREYAIALTQGEGADKQYGAYFHTWDSYNTFAARNVRLDNPVFHVDDGTLAFEEPYWRDFLEFRYNLDVEDGALLPFENVKAMNTNYRSEFFNENVAMLPTGSWMLTELEDQEKFPHDFTTAIAPIPTWPDGGEPGRTFAEAHLYSVLRTSQHPQEAYDFLRYYTTEGMKVRNVAISLERDLNRFEAISAVMGDSQYVNLDSLEATLNNPNWEDNMDTYVPSYASEIIVMELEETDLYLLGAQDLDTTINNMMERGQAIIDDSE